jgi:16S rRNA G966 N2-methylase RsmD
MKEMRPRSSLSNVGGEASTWGDPTAAEALAEALHGADEAPADELTHGFHTYPARMHPAIASRVLHAFSREGDRVLDPFCGSGTVLVEAMVAGCDATGVDLNPLALRIAEAHIAHPDTAARARFLAALEHVGEASLARVRSRTKGIAPLSADERAFYAPNVVLELAGIRHEILSLEARMTQRMLEVVLSSIIVKVSLQRADTSEELTDKRIRKGLTTEIFLRKGRELVERWEALDRALPPRVRPAQLVLGDARDLPALVRGRFDVILSSPPYGGTYDYHAHHVRRYPWLGIDASALEQGEVGARRALSGSHEGVKRWDEELLACLSAMRSMLRDGGCIVLLIGDAELGGKRVDAHQQIARLGKRIGLQAVAGAAQMRQDFRGGAPRREHLLMLASA